LLGSLVAAAVLTAALTISRFAQDVRTVETRIEIKVTGELTAAQRQQVGALLAAFEGQSPRLIIEQKVLPEPAGRGEPRKSKAGKYHFFPLSFGLLALVGVATAVVERKRRVKVEVSMVANLLIGSAGVVAALTGVLLIFGFRPKDLGFDVRYWHVVSGVAVTYLLLFHLIVHWQVWVSYARRLLQLTSGQAQKRPPPHPGRSVRSQ